MPPAKPITNTKIPGTDVPDIHKAEAESERQKTWMSRVAVSTAVMAALAAISSMFSGFHLNEAMIEQIRAADQWSFFQAKGIKSAVLEGRIETAQNLGHEPSSADTEKLARYKKEQEEIIVEAKARQSESDSHRSKYRVLARSAAALQIGIALAAVALLMRKNIFWILAILCGLVGAAFMLQALLAG